MLTVEIGDNDSSVEIRTTSDRAAMFSACGWYRYELTIRLRPARIPDRRIAWLLCNPSTADEKRNDPTVERCCRRSFAWGFDTVEIVNVFALRSTRPDVLYDHPDPIGPRNDSAIRRVIERSDRVVCGWGLHGEIRGRGAQVRAILRELDRPIDLLCLGRNESGSPRHPLYVPYHFEPIPMVLA